MLTIFAKNFITYVRLGSKYAPECNALIIKWVWNVVRVGGCETTDQAAEAYLKLIRISKMEIF